MVVFVSKMIEKIAIKIETKLLYTAFYTVSRFGVSDDGWNCGFSVLKDKPESKIRIQS